MKNLNQDSVSLFEPSDYQREAIPDTRRLQGVILESAKLIPQEVAPLTTLGSDTTPTSLFSWFKPIFRSTALATIFIAAVFSLLTIDFNRNDISPDRFTESDIEWQELMLINDELLFAQI